jgi:cell shape-determining protein MreD
MTRILLRALNGPILLILILIGLAIQSSIFSSWPLLYFQPDIVLLAVVWCGLRRGFEEGGLLTLLMAEICELHSSAPGGVYLISYMVVYLLVRGAARILVIPTLFSYAMLALGSSIVWKLTGLLVLYLLGASSNQWKHTLTFLFVGAAVEGVFAIWIYRWLDKFDWVTFKNARADHALEEELQLDSEGF